MSRTRIPPRWRDRWTALGPGLVWAAAAIGVSHLVQSTRAGAAYGFGLLAIVLLANLFKYPFFEFGPRYAAATGESLVEGYRRLGRWGLPLYLALTFATMFTVLAVVTVVTGSLATQVLGPWLSPAGYSAALLAVCALILIPGRYPLLDRVVKVIMVVLTLSTVAAVTVAVTGAVTGASSTVSPSSPSSPFSWAAFPFVIALIGWMPSAVDISVWHSLWTLERAEQTGRRSPLREVLFDFNLGYVGTTLLALGFLTLGALVLHGRGLELPAAGGAFAAEVVRVYTEVLGGWSRPVIAVAAFTTMFSTTLTVADAFPRVLRRAAGHLAPRYAGPSGDFLYWVFMAVLSSGALLVIFRMSARMLTLVDVATVLSFLTAPILSWLNLRAVTAAHVPAAARPPRWLRVWAWVGLALTTLFAVAYLAYRVYQIGG